MTTDDPGWQAEIRCLRLQVQLLPFHVPLGSIRLNERESECVQVLRTSRFGLADGFPPRPTSRFFKTSPPNRVHTQVQLLAWPWCNSLDSYKQPGSDTPCSIDRVSVILTRPSFPCLRYTQVVIAWQDVQKIILLPSVVATLAITWRTSALCCLLKPEGMYHCIDAHSR